MILTKYSPGPKEAEIIMAASIAAEQEQEAIDESAFVEIISRLIHWRSDSILGDSIRIVGEIQTRVIELANEP